MSLKAFRLTQRRYATTAFSGVGALHHDGRWHRAGIPVVYAAESTAVAVLELMVHVERLHLLTMDLVVISCTFEETVVERVEQERLPKEWRMFPWSPRTQRLGQAWFEEGRSAVLKVPSAVLPSARNYLINPLHPQFEQIRRGTPQPLALDPRLGH